MIIYLIMYKHITMMAKLALYCALKLEVKQPLWATFKLRIYYVFGIVENTKGSLCKHIDSFPKKHT